MFDRDVRGIGCGVPSVVDLERGVVYTVENIPSWREVPLKDELERRYGVPAYVNNDANAFTTPQGVLVRFVRGPDGQVRAVTVSVERVRDLRFERVER